MANLLTDAATVLSGIAIGYSAFRFGVLGTIVSYIDYIPPSQRPGKFTRDALDRALLQTGLLWLLNIVVFLALVFLT